MRAVTLVAETREKAGTVFIVDWIGVSRGFESELNDAHARAIFQTRAGADAWVDKIQELAMAISVNMPQPSVMEVAIFK